VVVEADALGADDEQPHRDDRGQPRARLPEGQDRRGHGEEERQHVGGDEQPAVQRLTAQDDGRAVAVVDEAVGEGARRQRGELFRKGREPATTFLRSIPTRPRVQKEISL